MKVRQLLRSAKPLPSNVTALNQSQPSKMKKEGSSSSILGGIQLCKHRCLLHFGYHPVSAIGVCSRKGPHLLCVLCPICHPADVLKPQVVSNGTRCQCLCS
ncbi:unnamed protein product [Bubo scandiacus]